MKDLFKILLLSVVTLPAVSVISGKYMCVSAAEGNNDYKDITLSINKAFEKNIDCASFNCKDGIYWAKNAFTNRNDPFYRSIQNSMKLFGEAKTEIQKSKDKVSLYYEKLDELLKQGNIDYKTKITWDGKSENNKPSDNEIKMLAIINGLNFLKSNIIAHDQDVYKEFMAKNESSYNEFIWGKTIADIKTDLQQKGYNDLLVYFIRNGKFFKHDWDCYVAQYGVLEQFKYKQNNINKICQSVLTQVTPEFDFKKERAPEKKVILNPADKFYKQSTEANWHKKIWWTEPLLDVKSCKENQGMPNEIEDKLTKIQKLRTKIFGTAVPSYAIYRQADKQFYTIDQENVEQTKKPWWGGQPSLQYQLDFLGKLDAYISHLPNVRSHDKKSYDKARDEVFDKLIDNITTNQTIKDLLRKDLLRKDRGFFLTYTLHRPDVLYSKVNYIGSPFPNAWYFTKVDDVKLEISESSSKNGEDGKASKQQFVKNAEYAETEEEYNICINELLKQADVVADENRLFNRKKDEIIEDKAVHEQENNTDELFDKLSLNKIPTKVMEILDGLYNKTKDLKTKVGNKTVGDIITEIHNDKNLADNIKRFEEVYTIRSSIQDKDKVQTAMQQYEASVRFVDSISLSLFEKISNIKPDSSGIEIMDEFKGVDKNLISSIESFAKNILKQHTKISLRLMEILKNHDMVFSNQGVDPFLINNVVSLLRRAIHKANDMIQVTYDKIKSDKKIISQKDEIVFDITKNLLDGLHQYFSIGALDNILSLLKQDIDAQRNHISFLTQFNIPKILFTDGAYIQTCWNNNAIDSVKQEIEKYVTIEKVAPGFSQNIRDFFNGVIQNRTNNPMANDFCQTGLLSLFHAYKVYLNYFLTKANEYFKEVDKNGTIVKTPSPAAEAIEQLQAVIDRCFLSVQSLGWDTCCITPKTMLQNGLQVVLQNYENAINSGAQDPMFKQVVTKAIEQLKLYTKNLGTIAGISDIDRVVNDHLVMIRGYIADNEINAINMANPAGNIGMDLSIYRQRYYDPTQAINQKLQEILNNTDPACKTVVQSIISSYLNTYTIYVQKHVQGAICNQILKDLNITHEELSKKELTTILDNFASQVNALGKLMNMINANSTMVKYYLDTAYKAGNKLIQTINSGRILRAIAGSYKKTFEHYTSTDKLKEEHKAFCEEVFKKDLQEFDKKIYEFERVYNDASILVASSYWDELNTIKNTFYNATINLPKDQGINIPADIQEQYEKFLKTTDEFMKIVYNRFVAMGLEPEKDGYKKLLSDNINVFDNEFVKRVQDTNFILEEQNKIQNDPFPEYSQEFVEQKVHLSKDEIWNSNFNHFISEAKKIVDEANIALDTKNNIIEGFEKLKLTQINQLRNSIKTILFDYHPDKVEDLGLNIKEMKNSLYKLVSSYFNSTNITNLATNIITVSLNTASKKFIPNYILRKETDTAENYPYENKYTKLRYATKEDLWKSYFYNCVDTFVKVKDSNNTETVSRMFSTDFDKVILNLWTKKKWKDLDQTISIYIRHHEALSEFDNGDKFNIRIGQATNNEIIDSLKKLQSDLKGVYENNNAPDYVYQINK